MDADYLDQLVRRGVISPDAQENMLARTMTHEAEAPNPVPGYLDKAAQYARTGLGFATGGLQGAGALQNAPDWMQSNPVQRVLQNPDNMAAIGGYTKAGGSASAIFGNPEKTARFFELLSQQKNPTEIAKELGVGRTTIRRMMAHEDIKNTNFGGGQSVFRDPTTGAPIPEKLDELKRLHAQGLPLTWIAAKMGTTETSISRWLDTFRQTGELPTRGTPYKPVTKFQQREAPAPDQDYAKALRELGLAL